MVTGNLSYSDPEVQQDLETLLRKFENSTFIDPTYTESWLRDFTDFVRRNEEFEPLDVSSEEKFIDKLTNVSNKE